MNIYKQATKDNWTFPSNKGILTVQQLWQLPLTGGTSLNAVAIELHNSIKSSSEIDFVQTINVADTLTSNKLDLVKDIIATKKAEIEEKQSALANQSHNAKIDELIAKKQDEQLASLSVEELAKLKK